MAHVRVTVLLVAHKILVPADWMESY